MPDYEGVFRRLTGPQLGSDAPGTGPVSKDSDTDMGSGGTRTPRIPQTAQRSNGNLGYGGAGEGVIGHSFPEPPFEGVAARLAELLQKAPPGPAKAQYNELYDTFRTRDAWRYAADAMPSGTFASPPNGTNVVSTTVTIPNNLPPLRLSQYPGAIYLMIFIRTFQAMVTVTTMTGVFDWFFTDVAGTSSVPLGTTSAAGAASGLIGVDGLTLTPIIDATNTTLGTLTLNAVNIGTTAGSVVWRLGISYAYLLPDPAFKGYVPLPGLNDFLTGGTETPFDVPVQTQLPARATGGRRP